MKFGLELAPQHHWLATGAILICLFGLAGCDDESATEASAPPKETQETAAAQPEEVPAEQRAIDFLWGAEKMRWRSVARRLSARYLEACGGTGNALGSVIVRDLGAQPTGFATPEGYDTEVASLKEAEARIVARLRLMDDTTAILTFDVRKQPDETWAIDRVHVDHRGESWTMCEKVPDFAAQAESAADKAPESSPPLTPDDVNPDEPIEAAELHEAVFSLFGEPVVAEAYVWQPDGDEVRLSLYQELAGAPDQNAEEAMLFTCVVSGDFSDDFDKNEPIYVKTVVPESYSDMNHGRLEECEVLAIGEPPPDTDPMPIQALWDRTFGWVGREVSVEGYYKGSSTSQLESGESIMIFLTDGPDSGFGGDLIECHMPDGASIPESAKQNRAGVIIRGVISGHWGFSGEVSLENCTFQNRGI